MTHDAAPALCDHQASQPKRLQQLVAEAIAVRHYSRRTLEAYWHWIKRFVRNGVRSGPVTPLFIAHRQQLGHLGASAQILAGLPLAGDTALIALALGFVLAPAGRGHWPGHASTSARCRAAHRL
jgi:hypothetical protein